MKDWEFQKVDNLMGMTEARWQKGNNRVWATEEGIKIEVKDSINNSMALQNFAQVVSEGYKTFDSLRKARAERLKAAIDRKLS